MGRQASDQGFDLFHGDSVVLLAGMEASRVHGSGPEDFFAEFLELPGGIPSLDTFNRVFAALDPLQFRECFLGWMRAVAGVLPAQVVALDGKTVRGSHDRWAGKGPIHMVSAWAASNRLVLAQVKVDEKSNEITPSPGPAMKCCVHPGQGR